MLLLFVNHDEYRGKPIPQIQINGNRCPRVPMRLRLPAEVIVETDHASTNNASAHPREMHLPLFIPWGKIAHIITAP